jgi:uncharacterized membrane protein YphA (DoxX/SURF4 family)
MAPLRDNLNTAWWALRLGLGLGPIIAGLDKYFNKLADWQMYLSPLATKVVPVSPAAFMHIVGVIEIVAGIIVLTRWTKVGAYLVMAWLLGIAVNLVTTGMFYDLAVRDVEIAVGAFALTQITAAREARVQVSSQSGKNKIKLEDGMRKIAATLVLFGFSAFPALAASETFKDVSVVDVNCSKKVAENPDAHTRDCALQCAMSGFGMLTADKKFVKFDEAGNARVKEALQASKQKDHLRADVSGEVQGDTLKVTSIKLL